MNKTYTHKVYTVAELLRYPNHPLATVKTSCPKCAGPVCAPAYPGDYFDCMSCGHSMEPTEAQIEKMRKNRLTSAVN